MNSIDTQLKIISSCLHKLDVDNVTVQHFDIKNAEAALSGYVQDLLNEIAIRQQKREYVFKSEIDAFYTTITSYYKNQELSDEQSNSHALANKLVDIESKVDQKFGHLSKDKNKKRIVKKGSFLQVLFSVNNTLSYLAMKLDHIAFIDEQDFIQKIGLPVENKIFKACKVNYLENGVVNESVLVFDTNSTPAQYWSDEFLSLNPKKDDNTNTERAIRHIVRKLDCIKIVSMPDYHALRNTAITNFKQNTGDNFDYIKFVENTFTNYVPYNNGEVMESKMKHLIDELKKIPDSPKESFDTSFKCIPSAVPYRKRNKIDLSKEITLSYEENISNLDDNIWSEFDKDKQQYVVIKVDATDPIFKTKP